MRADFLNELVKGRHLPRLLLEIADRPCTSSERILVNPERRRTRPEERVALVRTILCLADDGLPNPNISTLARPWLFRLSGAFSDANTRPLTPPVCSDLISYRYRRDTSQRSFMARAKPTEELRPVDGKMSNSGRGTWRICWLGVVS